MKLTTHHLRAGAALLLAGILLAGCDQSSSDAKHIKVGVINGAEQDVAEVAKKVAKEKTTVLQDLRKICTPQASLSDEAWEKLMLSDESNKQHIREAIVAMERNNQNNYWEALGKVECPDM
ncbi:YicS family protein [Escherichia coli]|uniref:YicS family protein n=1 Tax=Escherichia coli TaxID=562 RepID=UPI003D80AE11